MPCGVGQIPGIGPCTTRNRAPGQHASGLAFGALLLGASTLAVVLPAPASTQSCGVASLFDLCLLVGQDLDDEVRRQIVERYPGDESSMLEIIEAAEQIGLSLVGVRATLDELASEVRGPKIAHLRDPDHFVVIERISAEWVQVLSQRTAGVMPRKDVERRYTEHAAILRHEAEEGGPRVVAEEFHYDFGIVGVGQRVEHAFRLANTGDQDLIVRPAASSCGSAPEVSLDRSVIAPGASAHARVKLTVVHGGSLMRSIKLLTNDLWRPVVFLTVHGKAPHDLTIRPERLHLAGGKNAVPSRSVFVSGPADMDVTEVVSERGCFDIRIGEPRVSELGSKTWAVKLTFNIQNFVGKIQDELRLHTTHPDRPLVTIPVTGSTRGDVQVLPTSIFIGFAPLGSTVEEEASIACAVCKDFSVRGATADDTRIRVGPVERHNAGWLVPVAIDTSTPGVVEGNVVISTDVPGEERLEVPVYAHILAQE